MKTGRIGITLIGLLITTLAFAQTNTWTGSTDRDWHKSCNWSLGIIPTCSHDVVIPNTTNKPLVTGIAHCRTIDVASLSGAYVETVSSAGGIIHNSSINGGACGGTATDNSSSGCCTTSQWVKTSCGSSGVNERANDLVIDDNYMYAIGLDGTPGLGRQQWRIEKRNLSDGNLVTAFDGDGIVLSDPQTNNPDDPLAIGIDASGIYIGGYYIANPCCFTTGWRIEKRNATTGALMTAFDGDGVWSYNLGDQYSSEYLTDLVTNSTYVYAVGYIPGSGTQWHMKCLNATSGASVWNVSSDPSSGSDIAKAVAADASGVYIAGSDNTPGNEQWRIEKRNLTTGALITAFGSSGVVTTNPTANIDRLNDIAVDATGLYIAGWENSGTDYQLRIEKRDLTTGALITSFGTNGVVNINPSASYDVAEGIAVYNGKVHIIGVSNGSPQGWLNYVLDAATGATLCTSNPGNSTGYKIKANSTGSYAVGSDTGCGQQLKMIKLCNCQ